MLFLRGPISQKQHLVKFSETGGGGKETSILPVENLVWIQSYVYTGLKCQHNDIKKVHIQYRDYYKQTKKCCTASDDATAYKSLAPE